MFFCRLGQLLKTWAILKTWAFIGRFSKTWTNWPSFGLFSEDLGDSGALGNILQALGFLGGFSEGLGDFLLRLSKGFGVSSNAWASFGRLGCLLGESGAF